MKRGSAVAVIVLNYNGKHFLSESLPSLVKQSYHQIKIYVADAGSSDGSVEYVKKSFKSVEVIRSTGDIGPSGLSNFAVPRTKGKYVVLMSNDMKFDKDCVKQLVETLEEDPSVGICTSVLVQNKKDLLTKQYVLDNAGGDLDILGFGMPHSWGKPFRTYPRELEEVFFSYGGSFIIRRELFKKIGGFDRLFWGLSDDIDLSWRVRLLGYKVVVNPRSFLYHHVSPTLGKNKRSRNRFLSERNSLRMLLKNYSASSLVKILPRYVLLEGGEFGFYLLRMKFDLAWAIVRAFWWNLLNLPDTLKERSKIQRTRKVSDDEILERLSPKSYKLQILSSVLSKGLI